MLIWEKTGDVRELLARPPGLRIPGERFYRKWCELADKEDHVPHVQQGTSAFLLACFLGLQVLKIRSQEQWELYRLAKDFTFFSAISENKLDVKILEHIMYPFYLAQKLLNPAAVRPYTQDVDKLMQVMQDNKEFFEKGELKISPQAIPTRSG